MALEVTKDQLTALMRGEAVVIGPSKRVVTLNDGPFTVRHYGPGNHPGTGTPQTVHGRGGGPSAAVAEPAAEPLTKSQQDRLKWALNYSDRYKKPLDDWMELVLFDEDPETKVDTETHPYAYYSVFRPLGGWANLPEGTIIRDRFAITQEPLPLEKILALELEPQSDIAIGTMAREWYERQYGPTRAYAFVGQIRSVTHGVIPKGFIVHPSTEEGEGPWRTTTFDLFGFSGHQYYKTLEEALAEGVQYSGKDLKPAPDLFERIVQGEKFKEGTKQSLARRSDENEVDLVARLLILIRRHYGPGSHPGTGTPQSVHGHGGVSPTMVEGGEGGWWQDNPATEGYDWTPGPNQMTAGYRNAVVNPEHIALLPGARGEHRNIDWDRVNQLAESIKEEGLKSKPLIVIEQNGQKYIWEGNHRVRAAVKAGLKKIAVEIRYFGGSEELPGVWKPHLVERHYGPGPHPGTGTPQEVHGGGGIHSARQSTGGNWSEQTTKLRKEYESLADAKQTGYYAKEYLHSAHDLFDHVPGTERWQKVRDALDAIDDVHGIERDMALPLKETKAKGKGGSYTTSNNEPLYFMVKDDDSYGEGTEISTVHEIGHYIDHWLLHLSDPIGPLWLSELAAKNYEGPYGDDGAYEQDAMAIVMDDSTYDMIGNYGDVAMGRRALDLWEAIINSEQYQTLKDFQLFYNRSIKPPDDFFYDGPAGRERQMPKWTHLDSIRIDVPPDLKVKLLRPRELFARAYSQYIALRSGPSGQKIRTQIDEQLKWAEAGGAPIMWKWDDFTPIAEAFDALFREKQWLKP